MLFHCKCCKKYNNELINLHNKNKELLKENNELKKLKRSNKNPTQTNGSLNQGHNNNPEENQNQVQNQTQTYQAENLSLTNFPMNISSGVQVKDILFRKSFPQQLEKKALTKPTTIKLNIYC